MTAKLAREPLVHFLIGGAILFAFFAWRGEQIEPDSRTIEVSREVQAGLSLQFERSIQRAPTDAELDGLIGSWVRDEVLYREALRLGLDGDDAVVRRRMAKKMDGLASAQAELEEPSDATLEDWLEENASLFETGASYAFTQLYFANEAAALGALGRLNSGGSAAEEGDVIALPRNVPATTKAGIEARFGRDFVANLASLEAGSVSGESSRDTWQGPIVSGFGYHVVLLREKTPGEVPKLADIRDRVEAEWRNATIADRREAAYQLLREAYEVDIAP